MYNGVCKNISRSVCWSTRKSKSKLSWELYIYSLGLKDDLAEFWEAQDKYNKKRSSDDSFTRIDKLEKSVEIYKPPKSSRSESSSKKSKIFDNDIKISIDNSEEKVPYTDKKFGEQDPNKS